MDSLAHNVHPTNRAWRQPLGTTRNPIRVAPGLLPNAERRWSWEKTNPDIDRISGKIKVRTSAFGGSISTAEKLRTQRGLEPLPSWRSLGLHQRKGPDTATQLALRHQLLTSLTASHRSSGTNNRLQFDGSSFDGGTAGVDLRRPEARLQLPVGSIIGLPPPHMRSSVDEIVFGRDMDRSLDCGPALLLPPRTLYKFASREMLCPAAVMRH